MTAGQSFSEAPASHSYLFEREKIAFKKAKLTLQAALLSSKKRMPILALQVCSAIVHVPI